MPLLFSATRAYEPLPMHPAIEMDDLQYLPSAKLDDNDTDSDLNVVQLNAKRRAALAEVDNAPFSYVRVNSSKIARTDNSAPHEVVSISKL